MLHNNRKFWDVTIPMSGDMPCWPGDPVPEIEKIKSMENGDSCQITKINTPVHVGTHIDAPMHFIEGGRDISSIPMDIFIGPVYVAELMDHDRISAKDLIEAKIPEGVTRLLLKTKNSKLWQNLKHSFHKNYVAITPDAAQWIVDQNTQLIGIDYLSIELYGEMDHQTHKILLGKDVVVIEGLDLNEINDGYYELLCLPIKIEGSDGAPARIILMEM